MPRRIVEQPEEEEEEQVDPNAVPEEDEEGDPTAEEEPVDDEEAEEQPYRRPVRKAVAAPRAPEPRYNTVAEDTFKALVGDVLDAKIAPLFSRLARLQKSVTDLEGVVEKGLSGGEPVEKSVGTDPVAVPPVEPTAPEAAPAGTTVAPPGEVVALKGAEDGLETRAANALRKSTTLSQQHRRGFARRGAVDAALRGGYLSETVVKGLEAEIAEVEDLVVKGLL